MAKVSSGSVPTECLALLFHSTQPPDDLLHAEVIALPDARCHGVESRHLPTTQPLLLGLRSAPECSVERCVRRMGVFEPEQLRYSGEGSAFVTQNEGLLVTVHFVRHVRSALVSDWPGPDRR